MVVSTLLHAVFRWGGSIWQVVIGALLVITDDPYQQVIVDNTQFGVVLLDVVLLDWSPHHSPVPQGLNLFGLERLNF